MRMGMRNCKHTLTDGGDCGGDGRRGRGSHACRATVIGGEDGEGHRGVLQSFRAQATIYMRGCPAVWSGM